MRSPSGVLWRFASSGEHRGTGDGFDSPAGAYVGLEKLGT